LSPLQKKPPPPSRTADPGLWSNNPGKRHFFFPLSRQGTNLLELYTFLVPKRRKAFPLPFFFLRASGKKPEALSPPPPGDLAPRQQARTLFFYNNTKQTPPTICFPGPQKEPILPPRKKALSDAFREKRRDPLPSPFPPLFLSRQEMTEAVENRAGRFFFLPAFGASFLGKIKYYSGPSPFLPLGERVATRPVGGLFPAVSSFLARECGSTLEVGHPLSLFEGWPRALHHGYSFSYV